MEARFSAPVQTGPEVHPASYTMGTRSFPGVKRPGRGADHLPPSKCRGQERVGLYLCSPSGSSWPVIGSTFTFTFTFVGYMNFAFELQESFNGLKEGDWRFYPEIGNRGVSLIFFHNYWEARGGGGWDFLVRVVQRSFPVPSNSP